MLSNTKTSELISIRKTLSRIIISFPLLFLPFIFENHIFQIIICTGLVFSLSLYIYKVLKNSERLMRDRIEAIVIDCNKQLDTIRKDLQPVTDLIIKKNQGLPVFVEQLKGVIEQTDGAASDLISAFLGINKKAKTQASTTSNLTERLVNESKKSKKMMLETANGTMKDLINSINQITTIVNASQKGILSAINKFEEINKIVDTMKSITTNTRILALNAMIEAQKAGHEGRGFKIVADEVKKLSAQSNTSMEQIRNKVKDTITVIKKLHSNTEDEFKSITTISKNSEETISKSLAVMDQHLTEMKENLNLLSIDSKTISADNEAVAKEISKIIVSIQFQDITRQRIEHVITPLTEMIQDFDNHIRILDVTEKRMNDLSKYEAEMWLGKYYTMQSERDVLSETINQGS